MFWEYICVCKGICLFRISSTHMCVHFVDYILVN